MRKMKRDKNLKKLEIFKKGFRKNEIIIYSIALMLVTAGYFNYTANLDMQSIETSSENIINSNNTIDIEKTEISKNTKKDENEIEDKKEDEEIGNAKLVNSNDVVTQAEKTENRNNDEDYFIVTKLERETNYADSISTYTKILEDNSIAETQKAIAMKEITEITNTKNAISVCENILSTKGFEKYVVLINNDSVNVVVEVEGGLTKDKVAQIQNVVSRELNSKIENIHITEKKKDAKQ